MWSNRFCVLLRTSMITAILLVRPWRRSAYEVFVIYLQASIIGRRPRPRVRGWRNSSHLSNNDDYTPYVTPAQKAVSDIKGYGLLNARLTLAEVPVGDNQLQVSLWGKNLMDNGYRLNTVPVGPFTTSFFGNPRTYGLEAQYSF